jgi:signal peptidase I
MLRATYDYPVFRGLGRLFGRRREFQPGDRVVYEDGTTGVVHAVGRGYSHVYWDDEEPQRDFGGSRVPNEKLRRARRSR